MGWKQLILEVDELIRKSQVRTAAYRLKKIDKKIPREYLSDLAALTRRAGIPYLGLKWLSPYFKKDRKIPLLPNEYEQAEFAACLSIAGDTVKALDILEKLDAKKNPSVYLYKVFALIPRWEYKKSIPLLNSYLSTNKITEYQRLIAKVNLLAALVVEHETLESKTLVEELLRVLEKQKLFRLFANTLDLAAQDAIFRKNSTEADYFLNIMDKMQAHLSPIESLFSKKWRAAKKLQESKSSKDIKLMDSVRKEAETMRHWETLRSCDALQARILEDDSLFFKVYFGTPYEAFQNRIEADYPKKVLIPSSYSWHPLACKEAMRIEIREGKIAGKGNELKPGQSLHKLLQIFTSDFYRPFKLASLHSRLYPNEIFNPVSSPIRVHRMLKRFRDWATTSKLPFTVIHIEDQYKLLLKKPTEFVVSRIKPVLTHTEIFTQKMATKYPNQYFGIEDAVKESVLSKRATLYSLKVAIENGKVERIGKARSTKYKVIQ